MIQTFKLASFAAMLLDAEMIAKASPIYKTRIQSLLQPQRSWLFSYSFLELKWKSFNGIYATIEMLTSVNANECVISFDKSIRKALLLPTVCPANSGAVCPNLNAPTTTKIKINPVKIVLRFLPMLD